MVIAACSPVLSDILIRSGTQTVFQQVTKPQNFRMVPVTKQPAIFLKATTLRHLVQLVDFMYYGKVRELMGKADV